MHLRHARQAAALLLCAFPALAATCESLASAKPGAATVTLAQPVAATGRAPAYCRVSGVIKPSADSNIRFEVWLPDQWNGKLAGAGNGGYAGSLNTRAMAGPLSRGYATVTTDTGHEAGDVDATWALGHPERIVDFGYRAIHEAAVAAKALIAAYYSKPARHAYFNGCSNGGRQALMEAQRFPGDYDGIIAGAPANYWTHLLAGATDLAQDIARDPAAYIPPSKLPAIQAATLAACDAADGVKDGIIGDAPGCKFDPDVLLCKHDDSDACLTAPQVSLLKKIYAGPHSKSGKALYYGYEPGAETGPGGWATWITGSAPEKNLGYIFSTQFFSQMVYEDAHWDFRKFDADRDITAADRKFAATLNATDPNLKPFEDGGGKLILYHGWSDPAIPPVNAIHYYEDVQSKMGAAPTASFVRLYMAPGVQHCGGGPGPGNFIGNMETALEQWVENGKAPDTIIAKGAERTRPLCPYPQVARYKGSGSIDDAANFSCVAKP